MTNIVCLFNLIVIGCLITAVIKLEKSQSLLQAQVAQLTNSYENLLIINKVNNKCQH